MSSPLTTKDFVLQALKTVEYLIALHSSIDRHMQPNAFLIQEHKDLMKYYLNQLLILISKVFENFVRKEGEEEDE